MGWGFIGDLVDDVVDVASDVGSGIADAAEAVGEGVVDVAGSAGGYVGDTIGAAGTVVDTLSFGTASALANAVDDSLLDGVDYVTGGVVNIDFDDGRFSASAGIEGVATAGASIGENGITASSDSLLGDTDIGLTDEGLVVANSGGIDWGPLPYYEAHVEVGANGDIDINGRLQATIPTPYGVFSGSNSGGFVRTEEGWGTFVDTDGSWTLPSGVKIAGGTNVGYMEQGGDSKTTFGTYGAVGEEGYGTVGAGYNYESETHDGLTVTRHEGEVFAESYGTRVTASTSETELETPDGTFSVSESGVDLSGSTIDMIEKVGGALSDNEVTSGAPATAEAAPTTSFDDDILGTVSAAPAAPVDPMGGAADASFAAPDPGDALLGADPIGSDAFTMQSDVAFPVTEPDPVDDFTQNVGTADQIEEDTTSMFDDLG